MYNWFLYKFIYEYSPWRRKWQPTPVSLPGKSHGQRSLVGCSPWGLKESYTTEQLTHEYSLEKEMATHSSILAWSIPGTEEPGRLLLMESHRIGQDWSDLAAAAAWILTYEYSNIFMHMSMYSWNQYNILNQLYYNKSFKKGKKIQSAIKDHAFHLVFMTL